MPILTPNELSELRDIVQRHHAMLVYRMYGVEQLTSEERRLLEEAGELGEDTGPWMETATRLGALQARESQPVDLSAKDVREMSPPLTSLERGALAAVQATGALYVRNLSDRVMADVQETVTAEEQRMQIREDVETAVAERQGRRTLASRLRESQQDWSRDWDRVAATELQQARQTGQATRIRQASGDEAWVFKRPAPDACKWCKALHVGPDGAPRVFRLADLEATNVGRKKSEWKAVVGPTHPNCTCELHEMPEGWGFDEEGDLDPTGEFGVRYEEGAALERAMHDEINFEKAWRTRGTVLFQGMAITIENPPGSTRHWTDRFGRKGSTTMRFAYGFIKDTEGADGDEYDCFLGPDPAAESVFVVHQRKEQGTEYDEDKVMLGFTNIHVAIEAYLDHYDDPTFLGAIAQMPVEEFRRKVMATKQPGQDGMVKSAHGTLMAGHSAMARRNVITGGGGPNITFGNPPRPIPWFEFEHPAVSLEDWKRGQRERQSAWLRALGGHLVEDLHENWNASPQPPLVYDHKIPDHYGALSAEELRALAEQNHEHYRRLHRARVQHTVENSQMAGSSTKDD